MRASRRIVLLLFVILLLLLFLAVPGVSWADDVELAPEQVRRAAQADAKTWSSAPVQLPALTCDPRWPAIENGKLCAALVLSIDRAAIWNALLQGQGEMAGGLLPQWLSGYAFLFSTALDVERAHKLAAKVPRTPVPHTWAYDFGDPLTSAEAERVASNARDAWIALQPAGQVKLEGAAADMWLPRARVPQATPPEAFLEALRPVSSGRFDRAITALHEELNAAERNLVGRHHVIPLVHLAKSHGFAQRVEDWMAARRGGWRLAGVRLDTSAEAAAGDKP